jgi:hypothetical protein
MAEFLNDDRYFIILPPRVGSRYIMSIFTTMELWGKGAFNHWVTKKGLNIDKINDSVIIQCVRNPYSRMRSLHRWYNTVHKKKIDFDTYVKTRGKDIKIIENNQSVGLRFPDYVIRLENLMGSFQQLPFKLPDIELLTSEVPHYKEDIKWYQRNPDYIDTIYEMNKEDFKTWGYSRMIPCSQNFLF